MRQVKTIEDVNIALREIWNTLDNYRTNNLDMKKRRTVNASPSVDKYDYVVRKELEDLIGKDVAKGGVKLYTIVFSDSGTLVAGDKASPPFIVQRPGIPILVVVSAVTPPDTTDAEFNLKYNDVNILNAVIALPGGSASHQVFTSSDIVTGTVFEKLGVLNLNVVSEGTSASVKTTVEVFVKES